MKVGYGEEGSRWKESVGYGSGGGGRGSEMGGGKG